MNRSELNEKAKKYISDAGFGTGTNITLHGVKCLMVDFWLDNQVKNNVDLADVRLSLPSEEEIKLKGLEKYPSSEKEAQHYQNQIMRRNWIDGALWLFNKLKHNEA